MFRMFLMCRDCARRSKP
uniref:Uncharacterized protein n=1 Tax=Anguilla anguilla TaxID=7936 RepID=A0A0E9VY90_ANGAN